MIEEQAVRVEVSAAKLAGRGIVDVLQLLTQSLRSQQYGQQSIAQLNKQGRQLTSVDVDNTTIRAVKRHLKAYSVDFAVTKEKGTGKMFLWFKAQDVERIQTALQNCIAELGRDANETAPVAKLQDLCDRATARAAEANQNRKQQVPDIGERV